MEAELMFGRRGFFKDERGEGAAPAVLVRGAELWGLSPLLPGLAGRKEPGSLAGVPRAAASLTSRLLKEKVRWAGLRREDGGAELVLGVGEACRCVWVKLRERRRSLSAAWTDGVEPRASLEWQRLAVGFLESGDPDRDPGPEPGPGLLSRVKL